MHRYDEAIDAYGQMLSLIEESLDEDVRREYTLTSMEIVDQLSCIELRKKYISPFQSETTIEKTVREVFKTCPLVLIDVKSGRLCDGSAGMRIFKSTSQFKELMSSTTEMLDNTRIQRVVEEYFQYVMFSHVWAGEEPSFQDVNSDTSVWNLPSSPQNDKLKNFCWMVHKDGHRWAWSDTCCIDKRSSQVLSQSITMMYKWYEASVATFVHLADVDSSSTLGGLTNSVWMRRAWTAQELLAPKMIRFYDHDWKPYLGDTLYNHKESPEIVQELAGAIRVARGTIMSFNPDDLTVREKLRLASTRNATMEEDMSYAFIGIFKSDIKPHYGEGSANALGHLLVEIVNCLADVTVLAWAGGSSPYNSCLPATLAVYSESPYVSPPIEEAEMDRCVAALRDSLPQAEALLIHKQVSRLPSLRFVNRRLHLPSFIFAVTSLHVHDPENGQETHYRAQVSGIGNVDFQTSDLLSLTEPRRLVFVHPWICDLHDPLDEFHCGSTAADDESDLATMVGRRPTPASGLPSHAISATAMDGYTRSLQLIVRLQKPFHALLLQRQAGGEFKRVAAEHEIILPGLEHRDGIDFSRDIHAGVVEVL